LSLLREVGIPAPEARYGNYPHHFSGGMRQRVVIALALAAEPRLLIADEPTTALDVTVQRQVLELIGDLQAELGLAVLLITHDLGVVAEVCDRAAVMHRGRVVEHASVTDLFDRPQDPYTRRLLAARVLPDPPPAPEAAGEPADVLVVRGLRKDFVLQRNAFGRPARVHHAVRGVDFSVKAGETLSVVGESGAGKSTVGRMALRLVDPDAGRIDILGQDIARLKGAELRRMRAKATMIFQDPYKSLNPKRQIVHALAEPMLVQGGYSPAERSERILALMDRVGLGPQFLERYPYEMSGGQLQRVAIARALITDPQIVVCDEPVAALDMSIRAQVIELLRELQVERKLAYLFVSHDLSLVRAISDRIAVMRQGEIVEIGTPDELFANPQHAYTCQLLGAVPAPHPRERTFRVVPAA
jgi:ABC-type glutathione transport system ATPase component